MFLENNIFASFLTCVCKTLMYYCGILLQKYKPFHESRCWVVSIFCFLYTLALTDLQRLFNDTLSATDKMKWKNYLEK